MTAHKDKAPDSNSLESGGIKTPDLVARLRAAKIVPGAYSLHSDAADEIERLLARVADMESEHYAIAESLQKRIAELKSERVDIVKRTIEACAKECQEYIGPGEGIEIAMWNNAAKCCATSIRKLVDPMEILR